MKQNKISKMLKTSFVFFISHKATQNGMKNIFKTTNQFFCYKNYQNVFNTNFKIATVLVIIIN